MPYQKATTKFNAAFFCTFTCYDWIPLFHITNFYDEIYKWFQILLNDNNKLLGYVIMPNHIHFILYFTQQNKSLNSVIGNGKRFMAYEIVKRLNQQKEFELLDKMQNAVSEHDRTNNKLHQVFQISFDHKQCYSYELIEQKLDYIHHNPVSKNWNLVKDWKEYEHSSAGFYETGICNKIKLTHYKEIEM